MSNEVKKVLIEQKKSDYRNLVKDFKKVGYKITASDSLFKSLDEWKINIEQDEDMMNRTNIFFFKDIETLKKVDEWDLINTIRLNVEKYDIPEEFLTPIIAYFMIYYNHEINKQTNHYTTAISSIYSQMVEDCTSENNMFFAVEKRRNKKNDRVYVRFTQFWSNAVNEKEDNGDNDKLYQLRLWIKHFINIQFNDAHNALIRLKHGRWITDYDFSYVEHNLEMFTCNYMTIMSEQHIICAKRDNHNSVKYASSINNYELDFANDKDWENFGKKVNYDNLSPQEIAKKFMKEYNSVEGIYNQLSKTVYKQDAAKRSISLIVWEHMLNIANPDKNFKNDNYLMVGPTGSGKTELMKAIKDMSPFPVFEIDCSNLTGNNWKGMSFNNAVEEQIMQSNKAKLKDYAIFCLDEIDKLLLGHREDHQGWVSCKQANILKVLEGESIFNDKSREICKTKYATFILGGVFNDLFKEQKISVNKFDSSAVESNYLIDLGNELIKCGMQPDFAGRISNIIQLNKLTEEDLFYILKNMPSGFVETETQKLELQGIKLKVTDAALQEAAKIAVERGQGVRGANSIMRMIINEAKYDCLSRGKKVINITKDDVCPENILESA